MMKLPGTTLEYVLDMDLLTFGALVEVLLRVDYREKTEAAWTMMIAAQGQEKNMKSWVGNWAKITSRQTEKKRGSAADFLKKYGATGV